LSVMQWRRMFAGCLDSPRDVYGVDNDLVDGWQLLRARRTGVGWVR
jgi:hypothetical protein